MNAKKMHPAWRIVVEKLREKPWQTMREIFGAYGQHQISMISKMSRNDLIRSCKIKSNLTSSGQKTVYALPGTPPPPADQLCGYRGDTAPKISYRVDRLEPMSPADLSPHAFELTTKQRLARAEDLGPIEAKRQAALANVAADRRHLLERRG
jgi:hypothetical protein